jgi:membrane dipeptidase
VDPQLRGAEQVTATLEQVDWVHRFNEAYPDQLALARTAADVRRIAASRRTAGLIGVEGGAQIDGSLGVLRTYARAGARYMTLTWSVTTDWADSATDVVRHSGLNPFGRDVVAEMNRIGMIVDLAHVSPATMRDALDVSTLPVMVSHSASLALCDHPRNVPDDVVERIAAGGGVVMCAFVPSFVSQARRDWVVSGAEGEAPAVGISDVADHLDHLREVGGIGAVGLGADYDGTDSMPQGLDDVSGYQRLLEELHDRGWSTADLEAVAHGNALRVLEANDEAYLAFTNGTAPAPASSALAPAVDVEARMRAKENSDEGRATQA